MNALAVHVADVAREHHGPGLPVAAQVGGAEVLDEGRVGAAIEGDREAEGGAVAERLGARG